MPPKRELKKKKSKASSEKQYEFITKEEMKAKEQKYSNQLTELRKCLSIVDDALLEMCSLNAKELLETKWQTYLSCDPLPKPYVPANMRLFHSKLKYLEKENVDQNINWLLSVNERSILSQDIFRRDLTRRKLKVTLKRNIGQEYNKFISDSLKIFEKIEYFLDNDAEVAKCPVKILQDILNLKLALHDEIMDFMDNFTYRIISSENGEMESIDSICAEYVFNADEFKIHIWCLKNVALRISHLSEPRLLADFHSINLVLQIPANMLKENLVIRCVHMNFDHFSENAKSFKQTIPDSSKNLNAGILDLHECLVNEWLMQKEMQAKILDEMAQKRLDYEEKMRQYEAQNEKSKAARKRDEGDNKIKVAKPPIEPPSIEEGSVPNIYEDFLKEEQKEYDNFFQTVYHPNLLYLSNDEINLKKYFILGGIYQLYYIEKPIHHDFENINMTCHKNETKLVIDKNIKIQTGRLSLNKSHSQIFRRLTRRMTIIDAEKLADPDPEIESPWFIVTITLPEYLCFWGQPIACHFEECTKEVEKIQPVVIEENISKKTKNESGEKYNFKPKARLFHSLPNITEISGHADPFLSEGDNFTQKRKRLAASKQISRNSIFQDSLANSLLNQRKSMDSRRTSIDYVHIDDFPLTSTLTNSHTRHLERHIIPRIISSYKFPKEVQLEDVELLSKKPKGKGGKILRKKNESDSQPKLSTRQFNFNDRQNNPERMFVRYSKVEQLKIFPNFEELELDDELNEPETFAELVQVVNKIKQKYRLRKNKALQLKPIDEQIVTHNKRIRQMLKRNDFNSTMHSSKAVTPTISTPKSKDILGRENMSDRENLSKLQINEGDANLFTKNATSVIIDTERSEEESEMETYLHWTTRHIIKSNFDRNTCKMVLYTDRLGTFGFAFKRYEHFPFKYWSLLPSENDPQNEVVFTLDTQYVRCVLYITANGIRGHVTEASNTYIRNPKMYLIIEEPVKDYKKFKQLFKEKHLNIFADHDASFYIENGYFSEKHLSNELHTYNCMSVHCTQILFNFSLWNRLSKRRDIILKFRHYQDLAENIVEVRIMPGEAYFVDIEELCSDDLNVIKLNYKLTWRNLDSYSDLHHLIVSMYPNATESRCKNPKLIACVKNLLSEVRPLSFS